jgi:hypothetical protein
MIIHYDTFLNFTLTVMQLLFWVVLLLLESQAIFSEMKYNKYETGINVWNFSFISISCSTNINIQQAVEIYQNNRKFPLLFDKMTKSKTTLMHKWWID